VRGSSGALVRGLSRGLSTDSWSMGLGSWGSFRDRVRPLPGQCGSARGWIRRLRRQPHRTPAAELIGAALVECHAGAELPVGSDTKLAGPHAASATPDHTADVTRHAGASEAEASPATTASAGGAAHLLVTSQRGAMLECEQFVLLLDARTWASLNARELALDCAAALRAGIPITLLHECDVSGHRFSTAFRSIIWETPPQLVEWKIYAPIACALAGGEHRSTSLALAMLSLLESHHHAAVRTPRPECVLLDDPTLGQHLDQTVSAQV